MKLLLISSGVSNDSVRRALVDLLGKRGLRRRLVAQTLCPDSVSAVRPVHPVAQGERAPRCEQRRAAQQRAEVCAAGLGHVGGCLC
jgi:hypothetical protein